MNVKMVTIIGVMVVHNLFASNKPYLASLDPQSTAAIYRRIETTNRSGMVNNPKGLGAVSAAKRVRQRLVTVYGRHVGASFPLMFRPPLIRKKLSYQSLFFPPFFNSKNDREMVQIMINCLDNPDYDDEPA